MKFFDIKQNRACPAKLQRSRGFTLVETLVGLSIFTVSLLALMSVLASGISNTNYAKQKMIAGYLAQQGIEKVRNDRDNAVLYNPGGAQAGWDAFKNQISGRNFPQSYRIPDTDTDFALFHRTMSSETSKSGDDEVRIFSTVSWAQGSGNYSITFAEDLFNWVE